MRKISILALKYTFLGQNRLKLRYLNVKEEQLYKPTVYESGVSAEETVEFIFSFELWFPMSAFLSLHNGFPSLVNPKINQWQHKEPCVWQSILVNFFCQNFLLLTLYDRLYFFLLQLQLQYNSKDGLVSKRFSP